MRSRPLVNRAGRYSQPGVLLFQLQYAFLETRLIDLHSFSQGAWRSQVPPLKQMPGEHCVKIGQRPCDVPQVINVAPCNGCVHFDRYTVRSANANCV